MSAVSKVAELVRIVVSRTTTLFRIDVPRMPMPFRRSFVPLAAAFSAAALPAPARADSVPLGPWYVAQEGSTCVAAAAYTTLPLDFFLGTVEYSLRVDAGRATLHERWITPLPPWMFANYQAALEATRTTPRVQDFSARFGDAAPSNGTSTMFGVPPATDYPLGAAEPVLAAAARARTLTIRTPVNVLQIRADALPDVVRALNACRAASAAGGPFTATVVRTPAGASPTSAVASARERFIDALDGGRTPDPAGVDWPGGTATAGALVTLRQHDSVAAEDTLLAALGIAIGRTQRTFTELSFAATSGDLLPESRLATVRSLLLAWAVAKGARERSDAVLVDDRYRAPYAGDVPAFAIAEQIFRWIDPAALRADAPFDAGTSRELGRAAFVRGRSLLRYGVLASVDADLRYAAFELGRAQDAPWLLRTRQAQAALLDSLGLVEQARAARAAIGEQPPAPAATQVREIDRAATIVTPGWRAHLRRETLRSTAIGRDDVEGAFTFFDRWFSTMNALSLTSLLPADARTSLRPGVESAGLDALLDAWQRTPKGSKNYAEAFESALLEVQAATRGEVLAELASRVMLDPAPDERANVRDVTASRRAVYGEAWLRRERARLRAEIDAATGVRDGEAVAAARLRYLTSSYSARGVAQVYDVAIGTADALAIASGSDSAIRNRLPTTTARYAVSTAGLQGGLGDHHAVVVWYPAGAALHAFVVRRNSIDWVRTPTSRDEISRHVAAVRASIESALNRVRAGAEVTADSFATEDAAKLYALLVRPIEADLKGVDTLYVVPLGVTGGVPASMLIDDGTSGRTDTAGASTGHATRWLADRLSIVRMPALIDPRAFARKRVPTSAPTVAFLGVGAPPLGSERGSANAGTPASSTPAFGPSTSLLRDVGIGALAPLPNARAELTTAARILGERNVDRAVLTGAAATRSAVLSRLRTTSPSVLMFATHGLLGGAGSAPGEPALVVAREGDDDGLLRMSDVVPLDLRADLVILSACATAPSGDDGAEPLAGLASAFLIAGARTVVASHWRVATNVAETLTTGMLATMREKKLPAGAALQASARELRAEPETAHPVFWAPFEVIGLPATR